MNLLDPDEGLRSYGVSQFHSSNHAQNPVALGIDILEYHRMVMYIYKYKYK